MAAEGTIVRYIHPGNRLGVLLELNCETDFVAKGDAFQGLANELAMVAASCDAVCVSTDDMPADLLEKERQVGGLCVWGGGGWGAGRRGEACVAAACGPGATGRLLEWGRGTAGGHGARTGHQGGGSLLPCSAFLRAAGVSCFLSLALHA